MKKKKFFIWEVGGDGYGYPYGYIWSETIRLAKQILGKAHMGTYGLNQ